MLCMNCRTYSAVLISLVIDDQKIKYFTKKYFYFNNTWEVIVVVMYGTGNNQGSSRFTFKMSKNVASTEKVKPVNEVIDDCEVIEVIKVEERKEKGMCLLRTLHFYSAPNYDLST